MKKLLIILVIALSGCATYHTTLVNDTGQVAHCDHSGFGVIGTLYTIGAHQNCVEKYRDMGFREY